ncbi:sushi domain-containing protein 2-like [Alligator sinensis]|uniref:Sushi domain-containing protein 2-like n=1 Tax=Alligator sinensis TaxID=38654 RepID=A0A3Q0FQ32_ALLSI|nr:sushi domain-containing protein 2-like [Alligator sinensis]
MISAAGPPQMCSLMILSKIVPNTEQVLKHCKEWQIEFSNFTMTDQKMHSEAQDSCSRQCGKMLGKCSCQVTCKSLGDCCPDYREFCLQISPYSGSLMGGKDFEILNVTFNASSDVRCRFKQEIQISGYVARDGQAHCISPLLYETGFIPFEVSRDSGLTFPYSGNWLSVHHSKVSAVEKCTLVNATKWQYYGTPNTGGTLTVTWMTQTLPTRHVNIEVWGYQETGQTYSETWMAEWKYLYTLGREEPNSGTFTFTPVPAQANYSSWESTSLFLISWGLFNCLTRVYDAASAFGDPHFLTFDGLNFTFKGHGEYTLVESNLTSLRVQGRTQPTRLPSRTVAQVTGLSAVAMQESNSDVIEVRCSEYSALEVLLNQEVLNFSEQSWMDLKGLFLYSAAGQNVTVMFSSGAGVEVRARGGFLSLTVLLPEKFMNQTRGLLGVMNDNPGDEYTFRNGTTMPLDASPQQLFAFGADWAVGNETSLFTYDTQFLLNTFFYGPKHNSSFLPVFVPHEDPTDPLVPEMARLCDSDPFCRFDVLTTRSLEVGNATRISHQNHKALVESLQPVVSCGWLDHPTKGRKEGTNYLMGSTIRFSCDQGYSLAGSEERTCQLTGAWSGNAASCLPSTDNHQAILFGSIFGVLGFLILAVLIFLLYRKRKRANRSPNAPESVPGEKELMPVRGTHL